MRLKVQTLRTLLWLGNLLVIVAIAVLLGQAYMATKGKGKKKVSAYLPPERIEEAMKAEASIKQQEASGEQAWPTYDSCYLLNVTGKEPPPPPTIDEPDEALPNLKPITEVIRVDMFVVGGDGGYASIRYIEDGHLGVPPTTSSATPAAVPGRRSPVNRAEEFVRPGSDLRPPYDKPPFLGKVLEITPKGVRVSWGGRDDIYVVPDQFDRAGTPAPRTMPGLDNDPASDAEIASHREKNRASRKIKDHAWFIGSDEMTKLESEHEEILKEVGIGVTMTRDHDANEPRAVLKLTKVPSDSLVAERGFEVGDILHSINGEPISSKFAAIQYFKQHKNVSTFNVEIERRGTRIKKVFDVAR